jgi:hypothetical protein
MQLFDLDHVDPRWKEGRDYQLVCGLECSLNLLEREQTLNRQKSNRFLPWHVAPDEIGSVPINPGDLCQFLNQETGEWILEEFMGDWWFAQTKTLCGSYAGNIGRKHSDESKKLRSESLKREKNPRFNKPPTLGFTGFTHDEEAQKVQSEKLKGNKHRAGKPWSDEERQLHKQNRLGKVWWVNTKSGQTSKSKTSPGPDWVRGRKL